MTATAKPVNYTPEQTAELVDRYKAGETVEVLALAFSKGVKSIVAKLVREKVYVKPEATAKDGSPVVSKDELATGIGKLLKLTDNDTDSLTKCNKIALQAVLKALVNSKPETV